MLVITCVYTPVKQDINMSPVKIVSMYAQGDNKNKTKSLPKAKK